MCNETLLDRALFLLDNIYTSHRLDNSIYQDDVGAFLRELRESKAPKEPTYWEFKNIYGSFFKGPPWSMEDDEWIAGYCTQPEGLSTISRVIEIISLNTLCNKKLLHVMTNKGRVFSRKTRIFATWWRPIGKERVI